MYNLTKSDWWISSRNKYDFKFVNYDCDAQTNGRNIHMHHYKNNLPSTEDNGLKAKWFWYHKAQTIPHVDGNLDLYRTL